MCLEAGLLAGIGQVASAGIGVASAINQMQVADYNADMQAQRAKDEQKISYYNEARQRDRTRRALATQRAAFAANGLDTTAGAPLLAAYDSAREAELDALTIRAGGNARAGALMDQSNLTRSQGQAQGMLDIAGAGAGLLMQRAKWQNLYG